MTAPVEQSTADAQFPAWRRTVALIAAGSGGAALSMSFWWPFLPLYMQQLDGGTQAEALAWVAIAMAGSGIARLLSGPVWGVIADRYGRKVMFVRALYAATAVTLLAAAAREPWHLAVAFTIQGIFSGFVPAGIALTSVSVPQSRLMGSLGTIQGAQFAGNTVGPALGAIVATALGLRGAMIAGALPPALFATMVLLAVPRDQTALRSAGATKAAGTRGNLGKLLSLQLSIGILLYFLVFMMSQLVRTVAPIAISRIEGGATNTTAIGVAFTVAGVASIIGAVGVPRLFGGPGRLVRSLVLLGGIAAGAQAMLSLAGSVPLFILWFSLIALAQGAMMPATNTVIAASVPPARRGTAFGLASSAQALSFIVGPLGAALFAATSLSFGFLVLAALLAGSTVITLLFLREPNLNDQPASEPPAPATPVTQLQAASEKTAR